EPTALHLDFIKASEDAETTRENATRRALEERAQLLAAKEAAQARTGRLQKRARWALAVIAALVVIGIGAVSWQQVRVSHEHEANLHQQANLLGQLAHSELARSNIDGALRFSTRGARVDLALPAGSITGSPAAAQLAAAASSADWRFVLHGYVT